MSEEQKNDDRHVMSAAEHNGHNTIPTMHAVGLAMFHMKRLEPEQQQDLINAGFSLLRTIVLDDVMHSILEDAKSAEEVAGMIESFAMKTEQVRNGQLDRFFNLCELLKPDLNLACEVSNRDVVMPPMPLKTADASVN